MRDRILNITNDKYSRLRHEALRQDSLIL